MKYLPTYENLKLENKNEVVFEYFISSLKNSISTWKYFVGFDKVKANTRRIERELNLLNVLIGKQDIEREFIKLIEDYPKVRTILPILIAVRNDKLKRTQIVEDSELLISESKEELFNKSVALTPKLKDGLLKFFRDSGLKQVFEDKNIKSVVDYCIGVEVGMDTNARKNRTGKFMESLVEKEIKKFCGNNDFEYISQATKLKIKTKWNFDIKLDKTNRLFDFAIFNKTKNRLFVFETNFYGGGGSKLKSTAGEYKYLFGFLKSQRIDLIWVTDGVGWKTTKKSLYETFLHNDYLFNIELIKKDILEDIII